MYLLILIIVYIYLFIITLYICTRRWEHCCEFKKWIGLICKHSPIEFLSSIHTWVFNCVLDCFHSLFFLIIYIHKELLLLLKFNLKIKFFPLYEAYFLVGRMWGAVDHFVFKDSQAPELLEFNTTIWFSENLCKLTANYPFGKM